MLDRRTFIRSVLALCAAAKLGYTDPKAETAWTIESDYGQTIYNPTNGHIALFDDFAKSVGKWGVQFQGILFCRQPAMAHHVWPLILEKCRRDFPHAFINFQHRTITFATGERLQVRTMRDKDDYWTYHGHSYQWIGFESMSDWPNDECYNMVKTTLRPQWESSMPYEELRIRSTFYGK